VSLLQSAQGLLAGCVALARTRLELVGTELQEELTRLAIGLLGAVVVLLLAALGVAFAAAAALLAAGAEHRLLVAASLAGGFFLLAGAAAWSLRRLAQPRPLFEASRRELERDYEALTSQ
jgi:uncharacterized membrane protein YqjE